MRISEWSSDVCSSDLMALERAAQADDQEDRADDDVEAVEAGRHEEHGAVDVARIVDRRVDVFVGLDGGEHQAQQDGQRQALDQALRSEKRRGGEGCVSTCRIRWAPVT